MFNSSEQSKEYFLESKSSKTSNSISLTYEPTESSDWYFNMVAVSIIGDTNSSYTISIYGKDRDRKIQPGVSEAGEALPYMKYNFTFYSNFDEENNEPFFSLTLKETENKGDLIAESITKQNSSHQFLGRLPIKNLLSR